MNLGSIEVQVLRLNALPMSKALKSSLCKAENLEKVVERVNRYKKCLETFVIWSLVAQNWCPKCVPKFKSFRTLEKCERRANQFSCWLEKKGLNTEEVQKRIDWWKSEGFSGKFALKAVHIWKEGRDFLLID